MLDILLVNFFSVKQGW